MRGPAREKRELFPRGPLVDLRCSCEPAPRLEVALGRMWEEARSIVGVLLALPVEYSLEGPDAAVVEFVAGGRV